MLFRSRLLAASLLTAASYFLEIPANAATGLPRECFQLSRPANVAANPAPENYDPLKIVRKSDIVCIGSTVTISEPLYTNGGTLLIFADRLNLSAPIDSRPYRPVLSDWSQNSGPLAPLDQAREISRDSTYLQSYSQFYSSCFDCRSEGGTALLPRLPDGLVSVDGGNERSVDLPRATGQIAPDNVVDRRKFEPGSVTLLVRELNIDPTLSGDRDISTSCKAAFPDKQKRYAIEASGAYGGRGGAGSPSTCVGRYGAIGGDSCIEEFYRDTGPSGYGSNGGRGGTVLIGITSEDVSPAAMSDARRHIDVSGGLTVSGDSFLSPQTPDYPKAIFNMPYAATGSICDFYRADRKVLSRAAPLQGDGGRSDVVKFSRDDALRLFIEQIVKLDATPGYDFSGVMDDQNRYRNGILFSDHVAAQFGAVLRTAQQKLAKTIEDLLYSDKLTRFDFLPPIFMGLDEKRLESARSSSRILVLLLELAKYGGGKEQNFENFFVASGGLLNIATPDAYQQYLANSLRIDIGSIAVDLGDIKRQLAEIDRTTMEQLYLFKRQELEAAVALLQKQVSAAIEEAKKQSSSPLSKPLLEALGELGKSAFALYTSVNAGNAAGSISSLASLIGSVDKFTQLASLIEGAPLTELRKQLDDTRAALQQVFAQLTIERSRVSTLLTAALSGQVQSRLALETRKGARAILFEDLLKSIIIAYFSDPARDPETFRLNAIGLQDWLSDEFPLREPYFRVRDIRNKNCSIVADTRQLEACTTVDSDPLKPRMLIAKVRYASQDLELPLYVVAPTYRKFVVPTYGFETAERPIGISARVAPKAQ